MRDRQWWAGFFGCNTESFYARKVMRRTHKVATSGTWHVGHCFAWQYESSSRYTIKSKAFIAPYSYRINLLAINSDQLFFPQVKTSAHEFTVRQSSHTEKSSLPSDSQMNARTTPDINNWSHLFCDLCFCFFIVPWIYCGELARL
jgi:hypothetical protein